jgi:hypothetical protein
MGVLNEKILNKFKKFYKSTKDLKTFLFKIKKRLKWQCGHSF